MEEHVMSPAPLEPPSPPASALSGVSSDSSFTNASSAGSDESDINADLPPPKRTRKKVLRRDGGKCIVCWRDEDTPVHLNILRVAVRRYNEETTHDYIWTQGLVAEEWDRDHHTNLACFCNECGHKFLWGALTLVPVAEDRAKLFQHELADQERRRAEHAQNPDVWPDRQPATDFSGQVQLIICRLNEINFTTCVPGSPLSIWAERFNSARGPVTFPSGINPYAAFCSGLPRLFDAFVPCEEEVDKVGAELRALMDTFNKMPMNRTKKYNMPSFGEPFNAD